MFEVARIQYNRVKHMKNIDDATPIIVYRQSVLLSNIVEYCSSISTLDIKHVYI